MLKKLGLTGIVLSILLLNGCGTENKKDDSFKSSSTADVIIDNQSTQTISTIYIYNIFRLWKQYFGYTYSIKY